MDDDEFDVRMGLFTAAWELAEGAERDARRARWRSSRWKRWTVCWWKHRPRKIGPDTYVSRSCWACSGRG